MSPRATTPPVAEPPAERVHTADEVAGRVVLVAAHLVGSGKVVPTLVIDGDAARSRWLPMPGVADRDLLAALVDEDTLDGHRRAADALADAVDGLARRRLVGSGVRLVARRSGRRTVPQAWLESLTATDPALPASLPADKVDAFAQRIGEWVASGVPTRDRARLCLRVHEPGTRPDAPPPPRRARKAKVREPSPEPWWLELLVQDADEPSLVVPLAELWAGQAPFPTNATEEVLRSLARMAVVAPELADLLDQATPTGHAMSTDDLLAFVEQRLEPLAEVGVTVLLPSWWSRRRRVSLRARASSSTAAKGGVTEGALGFDQLVAFKWEAALGDRRLTAADLRQLRLAAEAKQSLVMVRGEWVQVDGDGLRQVLAKVGSGGKTTVGDLLRASVGLGDPDLDLVGGDGEGSGSGRLVEAEPIDVVAAGWLGTLLADVRKASLQPEPTPDTFCGELRPYQERGVGWLAFLGRLGLGACLADDMGLGKTAQLIATILAEPAGGPTLVICPVSVLGNWARELERFAPELTVLVHHGADRFDDADAPFAERAAATDVVLSTYSLVARDTEHLAALHWGRIVLDEAQQIKNPGTATAKAVRALSTDRRVALTGTPVENRLAELWSIMAFLNPGLLGSLSAFGDRFARPIERDADEAATATLQRLVGPFLLRRLKTDKTIIDDLPDKIEQTEHTPLTPEQASLYQAVVDDLLVAAAREEGIARNGAVLAGIAKLKQVCNHPAHFLSDGSPLAGRSGKLARVEELLDEIIDAGDKVLCFTQFTEWGDRLVPHLARRYGTEPLWLHGGVPRRRREEMMAAFADPEGPPIFLLSLKAGGTGLNLTSASHVIHLDRWWNPAVEDQATDRAYRIGQRRTVVVHKLVSTGTIEERIDAMITSKRELAQRVVGSGEQWITKLDTAALRDVVALRPAEAG